MLFRGEPRYDICPTQSVPIVFPNRAGVRQAGMVRWGIVPHWAKHPKEWRESSFYARSEDAHDKPAFWDAFRRSRSFIPAGGFYEWQKTEGGKVTHFIHNEDRQLRVFAGLMDVWRSKDGGERLLSWTILTTTPNELIAGLHDRMPVLLARENLA